MKVYPRLRPPRLVPDKRSMTPEERRDHELGIIRRMIIRAAQRGAMKGTQDVIRRDMERRR